MELCVLGIFVLGLIACVALHVSILWALGAGLALFCGYACLRGHSLAAVAAMLRDGMLTIKNIVIILGMVGLLTAVWRTGGTIPYIIVHTLTWIDPAQFALWMFLLCAGMSFLLGSAFATVTTLGVILMILARTAGLDEALAAGAIMGGIYVGDRTSPASSCASLVSALTQTNLYDNILAMLKSASLPFLLACGAYALLGIQHPAHTVDISVTHSIREAFALPHWTLAPALIILALSLLRVDVKISMLLSILSGIFLSITVQGMTWKALLEALFWGFHPSSPLLFLDGGGFFSMAKVLGVLLISSGFAGIFGKTALLSPFRGMVTRTVRACGRFCSTAIFSLPISALACNQTLAVILAVQVCGGAYRRKQELALHLADSVVLIAALIPWSIACVVPLTTLGAQGDALYYAFFLYFIPVFHCIYAIIMHYRKKFHNYA